MAVSPSHVRSGRRCADHMASTSAMVASVIMTSDGMGTRRSDTRRAPKPWTVPVMPSIANVVRSTGTLASQGEMNPKESAATAAGIINRTKGTTMMFEGNPMVVARWK